MRHAVECRKPENAGTECVAKPARLSNSNIGQRGCFGSIRIVVDAVADTTRMRKRRTAVARSALSRSSEWWPDTSMARIWRCVSVAFVTSIPNPASPRETYALKFPPCQPNVAQARDVERKREVRGVKADDSIAVDLEDPFPGAIPAPHHRSAVRLQWDIGLSGHVPCGSCVRLPTPFRK